MEVLYVVPKWFFTSSVILEILFAITTLAVAFYSFKIYKLSGQRESKLFGISFLLIGISYIVRSTLTLFVAGSLDDEVTRLTIGDIYAINNLAIYAYMTLYTISLLTLTYTTLKIKSSKTYSLLLLLSLFAISYAVAKSMQFYFLSAMFLFYITMYYVQEYLKDKNKKKLLVLLAFATLFISNIVFTQAVEHYTYYVAGHVVELVAYALVLISLVCVLKHGEKKK